VVHLAARVHHLNEEHSADPYRDVNTDGALHLARCAARPPLRRGYFNLLVQAVRRGIPLPFGSIRNRRAFVAVENLCSFVVDRLTNASRRFDLF
jgi:hypothetical protein